jgi:MFS family permease
LIQELTAHQKEMIVYGNIVYTIGSILVAAATTVRSFNFMIGGRVILALGDIATQIAQYKMFSSWFAPSNGFASTLGFELAIGKVWGYVGEVDYGAAGLTSV